MLQLASQSAVETLCSKAQLFLYNNQQSITNTTVKFIVFLIGSKSQIILKYLQQRQFIRFLNWKLRLIFQNLGFLVHWQKKI